MFRTIRVFLKRIRENYLLSNFLAAAARPVWLVCRTVASQIQMKVAKNGLRLPIGKGKDLVIGRNAGIGLASLLFWQGLDGYERETSATLRFCFARSSMFVDVGANCGLYSIIAALWNPEIRVVAFEAFPPIFENLKKNILLNHVGDRVVCENLALSSSSGTAIFHIPASEGRDYETTGTLAENSWQVRHRAKEVRVKTVRFDEYEQVHTMSVDLMKIDVEDFEADVLEGMGATILRDRPFIVCEILPRNKEHRNERTRQIIEALKYTAYWITSLGYIRVSRFDFERRHPTDFILSPVSTDHEIITDLAILFEARQRMLSILMSKSQDLPDHIVGNSR
jgi:FkbM family methyltransferase